MWLRSCPQVHWNFLKNFLCILTFGSNVNSVLGHWNATFWKMRHFHGEDRRRYANAYIAVCSIIGKCELGVGLFSYIKVFECVHWRNGRYIVANKKATIGHHSIQEERQIWPLAVFSCIIQEDSVKNSHASHLVHSIFCSWATDQSTQSSSCLQWHMHAQRTCGLVLRWTAMHYCNVTHLGWSFQESF